MIPPLLRCSVQVEVGLNSFALQLQQPRNKNSGDDNICINKCFINTSVIMKILIIIITKIAKTIMITMIIGDCNDIISPN
jgi:hypothetical protein